MTVATLSGTEGGRGMEDNKKSPQVVGATSEERKTLDFKNTRLLSSEELENLKQEEIALLMYYLIANGSKKRDVVDFEVIGKLLHGFAFQLINRIKID